MSSIADLIAGELTKAMREDRAEKPLPLPEAQIAEARLHAARVLRDNPFRPGDVVTARRGGISRHPGKPGVVVAALNVDHRRPHPHYDAESGTPTYCFKPDTLLALTMRTESGEDSTVAVWSYSFELEPYSEDDAA